MTGLPPELVEAWHSHLTSLEEEFGAEALARLREMKFGPGQSEVAHQQPTLAYLPGLRATAWWDDESDEIARVTSWLEEHFTEILEETAAATKGDSEHVEPYPHLTLEGEQADGWDVVFLTKSGVLMLDALDRFPTVATMLERFPRAGTFECFVSRLAPGTHLVPHCGTNNLVLTVHLSLAIPQGDIALRVHDETRSWDPPGGTLVFDDSFEHEAWNRTDEDRLALLVSFLHPDLTEIECGIIREIMPVLSAAYEELLAGANA